MGRLDPKQFNPKLIMFQMMALQCAYYLSLGVFLGGAHALFGTSVSMDHFFTAKHMNPQSATGALHSRSGNGGCFRPVLLLKK
jgi:hypothetical protein